MRTLVIGDIHGCLTALETLVESIGLTADDTLVTLGDYIDRGPDSKGVIDYLLDLKAKFNVITLKGNHELMLEGARYDEDQLYLWLVNGGINAAQSFGIEYLDELPQKYWDFMAACELYYETENHIIAHAGLEPNTPLEEQKTDSLCWLRIHETEPHMSGKTLICGHTVQRDGKPLQLSHAICIDTHAFGGKWLTCLDVDTGEYWQANQKKEINRDRLEISCPLEGG